MRYILSTLLVASAITLNAQVDRTKAPKPLAAKEIKIADAQKFKMPNGMQLIVVKNSKLPYVSATLTIDKLIVDEGDKSGLASITGELIRYGTAKLDKATLDEEVDFLGGSFSTGSLSASVSSLKNNFPKLFEMMSTVVLNPVFNQSDLDKVIKQTLSGIQSSKDDPSSIARNVNDVLMYGKNHPWGKITTEETVNAIELKDVKSFYQVNWLPNKAYLVFVGDITLEEAKTLANKYFGKWQARNLEPMSVPAVKPLEGKFIAIVDRPNSVQSYITVNKVFDLKPNSKDVIASNVANTILGGGFSSHLNQNLREKHGFTYGAGSSLSASRVKGSFSANAQVRNEKTDSAVVEMLREIDNMINKGEAESSLTNIKNYMSGGFSRSLEQPSTIARFALNTAINELPADYYKNYIKNLYAVTPEDIKAVSQKYLGTPTLITIVGKASEIAKGLEKIAPLKYFDFYGNEVEAPKFEAVDPSITGESLLQKALTAYGNVEALKDVTMIGKASMMGQAFDLEQKVIKGEGFKMDIKLGAMNVMSQWKMKGQYAYVIQGNNVPMDESMKADFDAQSLVFVESPLMNTAKYKSEVTGVEKINGSDAYVVKVTDLKTSQVQTLAFDKVMGFLVRTSKTQEGGIQGAAKIDSYYSDYKNFGGYHFPTKIVVDMGQVKQEMSFTDVKVNTGLTVDRLK